MDSNTLSIELVETKQIEPHKFIYGLVCHPLEIAESTMQQVNAIIKQLQIREVEINNHKYVVTFRKREARLVRIFEVDSRASLTTFVEKLAQVNGIDSGIIRSEINNVEEEEMKFVKELVEKAKEKASAYAIYCAKEVIEILGLNVKNQAQGRWRAHPPLHQLDANSIYSSIMNNYDNKDQVSISAKIEVKFKIA